MSEINLEQAVKALGIDVPVMSCRMIGGRMELHLYGGRVVLYPEDAEPPRDPRAGRSAPKPAEGGDLRRQPTLMSTLTPTSSRERRRTNLDHPRRAESRDPRDPLRSRHLAGCHTQWLDHGRDPGLQQLFPAGRERSRSTALPVHALTVSASLSGIQGVVQVEYPRGRTPPRLLSAGRRAGISTGCRFMTCAAIRRRPW